MTVKKKTSKKALKREPIFHARLIADIHFNEWKEFAKLDSDGLNTRLVSQMAACDELMTKPGAYGVPKHLIVAGDIIHTHGILTPQVAFAVRKFFDSAEKHFENVVCIPGNHDYELKSSGGVGGFAAALNSLVTHDSAGITEIITEARTFDFNQVDVIHEKEPYTVGFVPWIRDKTKFREAVESVAAAGAKMLITHIAVEGFKTDNGWTYEGGMSKSVLMPDKFDAVFLGDFHTRQSNGNVYYIGAPYQMNWNDCGDDARGALDVAVFEDGTVEVTSIESSAPKFVKVESLEEARKHRDAGDFVRIVGVTQQLSKKDREGISVEMAPPVLPEQRLQVEPDSSVMTVLDAYLETCEEQTFADNGVDLNLLREVCSEIVGKVDTADLMRADSTATLDVFEVEAENFLGYSKLGPIDVHSRGVVLIDGDNRDDEDALSNGAGKSTLVEAVFWCLFGKTLRDCTASEVSKRDSKGGTFVRLSVILKDGRNAEIFRCRKMKGRLEGLTVEVDGKSILKTADAQKELMQLTGITSALFKQVVVFGQEIESVFAASTDAERKALLENLCSGGQFEPVYAQAKTALDECEVAVRDVEHSIATITKARELQSKILETEKQREASYAERCEQEAKAVEAEIKEEEKALAAATSKELELAEKISKFEELLSAYDGEHDEEEFRKRRDDLRDEMSEARSELSFAQSRLRSIAHNLDNVGLEIGMKCENCQQIVTEQSRESIFQTLRSDQDEHLNKETQLAARITELEAEIIEVDGRLATIKKNRDEKRDREREFDRLDNEHRATTREMVQHRKTIKSSQERLESLRDVKQNPHIAAVEKYEADLKKANAQLEKRRLQLEQLQNWHPYFKEACRLFGNQGLKTFLFDSLAPKITQLANDALRVLSSGTLSVEMSTERTKAGEKISLTVNNSLGAASYAGNSGGQKKKIDLALCWAISQLVEGRINLFFIDEAFDGLDALSCERVSELLTSRSVTRGTIFVITHRSELRDQFSNVWTAVRENGDSTLQIVV